MSHPAPAAVDAEVVSFGQVLAQNLTDLHVLLKFTHDLPDLAIHQRLTGLATLERKKGATDERVHGIALSILAGQLTMGKWTPFLVQRYGFGNEATEAYDLMRHALDAQDVPVHAWNSDMADPDKLRLAVFNYRLVCLRHFLKSVSQDVGLTTTAQPPGINNPACRLITWDTIQGQGQGARTLLWRDKHLKPHTGNYGKLHLGYVGRKAVRIHAHRLLGFTSVGYDLTKAPSEDAGQPSCKQYVIMHKGGQPACCQAGHCILLRHLTLGTHSDNFKHARATQHALAVVAAAGAATTTPLCKMTKGQALAKARALRLQLHAEQRRLEAAKTPSPHKRPRYVDTRDGAYVTRSNTS
jgi:hypothetical protein